MNTDLKFDLSESCLAVVGLSLVRDRVTLIPLIALTIAIVMAWFPVVFSHVVWLALLWLLLVTLWRTIAFRRRKAAIRSTSSQSSVKRTSHRPNDDYTTLQNPERDPDVIALPSTKHAA